jgi:hypothetical protein
MFLKILTAFVWPRQLWLDGVFKKVGGGLILNEVYV